MQFFDLFVLRLGSLAVVAAISTYGTVDIIVESLRQLDYNNV